MVVVAAVIAVALVVAFVMIRSGGQTQPAVDTGQTQTPPTTGPGGMGSGGSPSKGTGKVIPIPEGTSPSQYLTKVYGLVQAKKYEEAFKLYPDSVQQGGFQAFKSSRESMPVKSFKVGSQTTKGDTATIAVKQTLGGQAATAPNWVVTWHFKKTKGQWAVVSYDVNMAQ